MNKVYKIADNIITSLGVTTAENMAAILQGQSGVKLHENEFGLPESFQASAVAFDALDRNFETFAKTQEYTPFERMVISSVRQAAQCVEVDLSSPETLFILSTTKGNIALLDPVFSEIYPANRINLWASGTEITRFFKNPNLPIIVSQACISGVSAILLARMYLKAGSYKTVVVTGGDVLSKFVVSGFQSFKALSPNRCKPFDASRDGLSLGEGAATIILGVTDEKSLPAKAITVEAGATSNDANHISGPSRTGEGLFRALNHTLQGFEKKDLAFINAHGTATPYNDEMEAIAISRANLADIPVNSLKGYFGHTMGAAGIIEAVVSMQSLINNHLIRSLGFENLGVSKDIHVITEPEKFEAKACLKMASGFGGCNAVVLLKKYNS